MTPNILTPNIFDERKAHGGIRINEIFSRLAEMPQFQDLAQEAEAWWRLVDLDADIAAALDAVELNKDGTIRRAKLAILQEKIRARFRRFCVRSDQVG